MAAVMPSTSISPIREHLPQLHLPQHLLVVATQKIPRTLRIQPRRTMMKVLKVMPTPTSLIPVADVLTLKAKAEVAEGPADTLPSLSTLSLCLVTVVNLKHTR